MLFLVVLKRFEVWLLLAVVAALIAFAFRSGTDGEGAATEAPIVLAESLGTKPPPERPLNESQRTPETLRIGEVRMIPSEGGIIVETVLTGRSPSGTDLVLDEGAVSATNEAGEAVPRFFEPFREPETLLGEGDSLASVRWWLVNPEKSIWIAVGDRRLKADLP